MTQRDNEYVTNWHAATAGDIEFLQNRSQSYSSRQKSVAGDQSWPSIGATELNRELVNGFMSSKAMTSEDLHLPLAIQAGALRAVVEPISERQFLIRGYLTDLSKESTFAIRVKKFIGKDIEGEENELLLRKLFGGDRIESYAGTKAIETKEFVASITFSDFATFEMEGVLLRVGENDWASGFKSAIHEFLSRVTP